MQNYSVWKSIVIYNGCECLNVVALGSESLNLKKSRISRCSKLIDGRTFLSTCPLGGWGVITALFQQVYTEDDIIYLKYLPLLLWLKYFSLLLKAYLHTYVHNF
jgi:hypothetical protein